MQVFDRNAEGFEHLQRDGRENGVTLLEEGIQRPSEAIVVHLLERHVKEEVGASVFGPLAEIGKRDGLMSASRDEDTENFPMSKVSLRIGGEMLVNDVLDAHALEHGHDDREPTEWLAFDVGVFSVTESVHQRSMERLGRERKPIHYAIFDGCGK